MKGLKDKTNKILFSSICSRQISELSTYRFRNRFHDGTVCGGNVTSILGCISKCGPLCTSCTASENWSHGQFNLNITK